MDPMPCADEIWKAYATYYTHTGADRGRRSSPLKRYVSFLKRGYWAGAYGYHTDRAPFLSRFLGLLLYLSPIHRRETDAEVRCLPAVYNGRLLDVGCGSGDWLLAMRDRGWVVEGLDFDEKAVAAAQQRGMHVRLGSLEQQQYPDNSFDAVTLSHVIEHVPDPVQTVRECLRVLKPGGRLVLFTPNSDSLSHRVFKRDWRGLEPPRHLHIFSLGSMDQLLVRTGFQHRSVRPFIVTSVIYDSLQLRWKQNSSTRSRLRHWLAWGITRLFKLLELCLIKWNPKVGDCLIAIAEKPL